VPEPGRVVHVSSARATTASNIVMLDALQRIAEAFADTGIGLIALKGVALLGGEYPDFSDREMCDIDLLIRPGDRSRADQALRQLGASVRNSPPDRPATVRENFEASYSYSAVGIGIAIDLHTALEWPEAYPLDIERLFHDSRPHPLDELACAGVRRLSPEHFLLHLALHRLHHCYDGDERNYRDADRLLASHVVSAEVLAREAHGSGTQVVAWLFLKRAEALGIAGATELAAAIEPSWFRQAALRALLNVGVKHPFRVALPLRLRQLSLFVACATDPRALIRFPLRYLTLRGMDLRERGRQV
jgi:hypothetical protein